MFTLNKIVGCLISPAGFSIVLVAAAVVLRLLKRMRIARWAVALALANFWIWSMPLMSNLLGVALEKEFLVEGRVPTVESLPQADLIALHGGSMGLATNISPYAEMWTSADRVWQSARIWKAGKASVIYVSSANTDLSTGPLLADLGVPKEAVVYDFGPRNTEEEARAIAVHCSTSTLSVVSTRPKVLVVTSAWHMKRTMLMYEKYAPNVEAIPAPCDFENTLVGGKTCGWACMLPDSATFMWNCIAFHERLGYFGYKWLR